MKKFLYTLLFCSALIISGKDNICARPVGPCTIDTSNGCIPGSLGYGKVCPGTFANATGGVAYSATNSFEIPDSFPLNTATFGLDFGVIIVTVDQITATVTGLPQGLSATFDQGSGIYYPSASVSGGCFTVSGIPCDTQGTFSVNLSLIAKVTIPLIGTITLPFPLNYPMTLNLNSTYPLLTISAPYSHLCLTGEGSNVTIAATPGFGVYAWSNAATTDSITVDTAAEYSLTVTTTDNACHFYDSIQIGSVQAQVTGNTTICKGIFLQLNATGGDTYTWTPSQNLNHANIANPVVLRTLDSTTQFTVTVSNGFCSDSASVTVSVSDTCVYACANCTPATSGCTGALPTLCSTITPAQTGAEYNQSVTFYLPDSIAVSSLINIPITIPGLPTTVALDNAQITVDTLPTGFSWNTDQSGNNNMYYPTQDPSEQYGCISICGKTCDPAGSNYMKVKATILLPTELRNIVKNLLAQGIKLAGLDTIVTIPVSGSPLTVYFADSLVVNPYGNIGIHAGDTITLQPSIPFASYSWSTGSKNSSIAVDTAGEYCLTVTDTAGCSQTNCKEVSILSGIADVRSLDASLNIYPNPNDGVFNLTFNMTESGNITSQVFDVTGKVIYQTSFMSAAGKNNMVIDLGSAAKGIYLVRLTAANGVVNRKITIE